jgi:hypothetical protein
MKLSAGTTRKNSAISPALSRARQQTVKANKEAVVIHHVTPPPISRKPEFNWSAFLKQARCTLAACFWLLASVFPVFVAKAYQSDYIDFAAIARQVAAALTSPVNQAFSKVKRI